MHRKIISLAIITLLFASLLATSCKTEKQSDMIVIPMDVADREIFNIDLSRCDTIILDTGTQALMYQIDQILFGENEMCILGRSKVSLFRYDGTYICDLGGKGRGPGEYLSIGSIYKQKNAYCIYDWQAKKISHYDKNGNYIKDEYLPENKNIRSINKLFPLNNSIYAALNTFNGLKNNIPAFSVYNSAFDELFFSDRMRNDGNYYIAPFSRCNNEVLFSDFLCDTLYSITSDGIKARYWLDFGKYALPGAIDGSSDHRRRVEYVNLPQNLNKIATMIQPASHDDKNLYVAYYFREGKVYLLRYNKQTGKSRAYQLWDPSAGKEVQFSYFTVHNNILYLILNVNSEDLYNPLIICVPSDSL